MKKRLLVLMAVLAFTASAADITGNWKATLDMGGQSMERTFVFKQDGAKLTGENFRYPWQVHVYQQGIKIGNVLYQLPCYCRCDRALGHTSLRSCYESAHATMCSHCAKEGFFAYRMTRLGKTPAQIRDAINRHEYETIDLEKQ